MAPMALMTTPASLAPRALTTPMTLTALMAATAARLLSTRCGAAPSSPKRGT